MAVSNSDVVISTSSNMRTSDEDWRYTTIRMTKSISKIKSATQWSWSKQSQGFHSLRGYVCLSVYWSGMLTEHVKWAFHLFITYEMHSFVRLFTQETRGTIFSKRNNFSENCNLLKTWLIKNRQMILEILGLFTPHCNACPIMSFLFNLFDR